MWYAGNASSFATGSTSLLNGSDLGDITIDGNVGDAIAYTFMPAPGHGDGGMNVSSLATNALSSREHSTISEDNERRQLTAHCRHPENSSLGMTLAFLDHTKKLNITAIWLRANKTVDWVRSTYPDAFDVEDNLDAAQAREREKIMADEHGWTEENTGPIYGEGPEDPFTAASAEAASTTSHATPTPTPTPSTYRNFSYPSSTGQWPVTPTPPMVPARPIGNFSYVNAVRPAHLTRDSSGGPSVVPSGRPSGRPSVKPSGEPSGRPSGGTSGRRSGESSGGPSGRPSGGPSGRPSGGSSGRPSGRPSGSSPTSTSASVSLGGLSQAVRSESSSGYAQARVLTPINGPFQTSASVRAHLGVPADASVAVKRLGPTNEHLYANDESLQRYKQSLGLGGDGKDLSDPNDPRVCIIQSLTLESCGRDPVTIDLSKPGSEATLKDKPFKIKEGAKFTMVVAFKVQHEILSGLQYVQIVKRKGIRVSKDTEMLGSFPPNTDGNPLHTKRFTEDEAPTGMLARGHYNATSSFVDDDKKTHLTFEWSFDISKDW